MAESRELYALNVAAESGQSVPVVQGAINKQLITCVHNPRGRSCEHESRLGVTTPVKINSDKLVNQFAVVYPGSRELFKKIRD